jgi:hypothetical protein
MAFPFGDYGWLRMPYGNADSWRELPYTDIRINERKRSKLLLSGLLGL